MSIIWYFLVKFLLLTKKTKQKHFFFYKIYPFCLNHSAIFGNFFLLILEFHIKKSICAKFQVKTEIKCRWYTFFNKKTWDLSENWIFLFFINVLELKFLICFLN